MQSGPLALSHQRKGLILALSWELLMSFESLAEMWLWEEKDCWYFQKPKPEVHNWDQSANERV